MFDRYLKNRSLPLPIPYIDLDEPIYDPDPDLPPAILVDIDGTVAVMGARSPYDWDRGRRRQPERGGHLRGPGHATRPATRSSS